MYSTWMSGIGPREALGKCPDLFTAWTGQELPRPMSATDAPGSGGMEIETFRFPHGMNCMPRPDIGLPAIGQMQTSTCSATSASLKLHAVYIG